MRFLSVLSRLGLSISMPRWLISFSMLIQAGTRGVSIGTRVIIFDANGDVFLVRHSYMKGWYFPGGGVERGELTAEAAKREVREEARIIVNGEPEFFGIYLNDKLPVPDYITCYIVRDWRWDSEDGLPPAEVSLDGEIVESGFYSLNALPEGTSLSTKRRILEVTQGLPQSKVW